MKMLASWSLALVLGLCFAPVASADVALQLSDVHICCGACVKGIQKAVDGLPGKVDIDRDGGQVKIAAADAAAAQKIVDAIAAAGYHGESDNPQIAMKNDSGAPAGTVTKLKVSGVHNCCQGCTNAIRDAFKGVAGVQNDTLKNRATEFEIDGNFDAQAVVKALHAAGFHVKVTK